MSAPGPDLSGNFVPAITPDGTVRTCGCGTLFTLDGPVFCSCLCAGLDVGHCDGPGHDDHLSPFGLSDATLAGLRSRVVSEGRDAPL